MQSTSIFTRQRMGLDNNVWIMLIICTVLPFGLLGFKLMNRQKEEPCVEKLNIFVDGRLNIDTVSFKTARKITFRSSTSATDHVVWNFNDETSKEEGSSAIHSFDRDGTFTVVVSVNNKCEFSKRITVEKESEVFADSTGKAVENIVGNNRPIAGEKVAFYTTLPATSYEWFLENINASPKSGKNVTFQFTKQQEYTLVLRLDHDNKKKFTKIITVAKPFDPRDGLTDRPKPLILPELVKESPVPVTAPDSNKVVHPEPVKKKIRFVSDEILMSYIQSVVCKEMNPEQFDDYLCLGVATPVIVNDKERKLFSQLCSDIKDKKIKIESVEAKRDGDNCVTYIKVNYDKKGFLGRNPCKN